MQASHIMCAMLLTLLVGITRINAGLMQRLVPTATHDGDRTTSVAQHNNRCIWCDLSTVSVPFNAPEPHSSSRATVLEQYWQWLQDNAGVSHVCGWRVGRVRHNIAALAERLRRVFILVEGDSFARNAFFAIIQQAVHPREGMFQWSPSTYHQPHIICCGDQDADGYLIECSLKISPTPSDAPGLVTQYFDTGKQFCIVWLWDPDMDNGLSPWQDACMLPHVYAKNGGLHLDVPPAEYRKRFSRWAEHVLSVNAEIAQSSLRAHGDTAPAACGARAEAVRTYFMGTTHNPYHEWSVEQQYNLIASSIVAAQACDARTTCISLVGLAALAGIDDTGRPHTFHTLRNGTDIHYGRPFYMWAVEPILHSAAHMMPLC